MRHRAPLAATLGLLGAAACAGRPVSPPPPLPPSAAAPPDRSGVTGTEPRQPLLPPQAAMLLGLLPRRSVGIDAFLAATPAADGRGVVIAILDSGIDAGLPGLKRTTTGDRKLLDLRDFSDEGHVPLAPVEVQGDTVTIEGTELVGVRRVARWAVPPYYGGVIRERPLGSLPAADLNGDGDDEDRLPVIVARGSSGWFVMTDTDGDGSLADEAPIHDYAVAAETFSYGPSTLAVNFGGTETPPRLDLFFDNSGHGTHVAGIAAGHDLFGVTGFAGAAPGAQLLGLKIANNARGGVSVSGSMRRALEYAARYAGSRNLPLIVNLSFGVGNEDGGGTAVIDSLIDAFALAHPEILIVISAGNDGPGISTVGFPGSAEFALSVCALFPGVFAASPQPGRRPPDDVLGWWSARGGEFAKPELCVPGVAFSNVPLWHTGEEVAGGTSMAAPLLSGVAALLQSARVREGKPATAVELRSALTATATPLPGATVIEQGAGLPNVTAALRWLRAGHRAGRFAIRSLPDGSNTGVTGAYRRGGLASRADTLQRFRITSVTGQPFARLLLRSDAPWLRAPDAVDFAGEPATVELRYDERQLRAPGLYVGTVWARPATDTLSGAAFWLTNTIVVPQRLENPYTLRKYLRPGRSEHLFLEVPEEAGGLELKVTVRDPEQHASVYLFEPSGQPFRDRASVEVGGELGATAVVLATAQDLFPGVYEAVVVAPPTAGVTFELRAALPPVAVTEDTRGVRLTNRTDDPLEIDLEAVVLGALRRVAVDGSGTVTRRVAVEIPDWATELVVDVELPRPLWSRFTDFAVSVWDTAGRLVSQSPLNYAFGRQQVRVDTLPVRALEVELFPAFALADDRTRWEATVALALLGPREPAAPNSRLRLDPKAEATLSYQVPEPAQVPEGFRPYLEVSAQAEDGALSVRRLVAPDSAASTGATR